MVDWGVVAALLIGGAALVFVWRGVDVRLVLLAAGFLLALVAGKPHVLLDAILRVMGDGSIVGPICSAMGYAFVLRALGADRAMVELLIEQVRKVRWLLVPGGCVVGFLVNMAITSQTAAAAAVGPILVPLLARAGYSPAMCGAVLVVGCSTGGNLFNPGEPDVVTIAAATGAHVSAAIAAVSVPHLVGFAVATLVVTALALRQRAPADVQPAEPLGRRSLLLSLLPPLPIALLFLLLPQWKLVPQVAQLYPAGVPVTHVMVPCAALAIALYWRRASELARSFFEGLGYGFANVISIIIAAAGFLEGLKAVGALEHLIGALLGARELAPLLSLLAPMALAVLSGSGTAPSVTFSKAVLPSVVATEGARAAVELGVLGAIGASLGRTMSPMAAVVIFSAQLVQTAPRAVVRLSAPAMLAASVAALVTYYLFVR